MIERHTNRAETSSSSQPSSYFTAKQQKQKIKSFNLSLLLSPFFFCSRSGPPSTEDATIRYCTGTSTQPVAVKREVVLQLCAQHSWNGTRRRFNERKETSIHITENQPVVDTKSRVKLSFSDHCFDSTNGIVSPTAVKYIIYNII